MSAQELLRGMGIEVGQRFELPPAHRP
jgi:hypothetical protein